MKNKMKNKKGFTLMEMLIVVAIMVILVAVAVPTFTSQLNKAKTAADDANIRSARGLAATQYLVDGTSGTYLFDALNGKLVPTSTTGIDGYGQGTSDNVLGTSSTDKILQVVIADDGSITITWVPET